MITKDKRVRVSAKAIIIRNSRILLMRAEDQSGVFYVLPGGGQKNGENLTKTLKRECLEETGAEIIPGKLRFLRDYIAKNHEFADENRTFHQVEPMFICRFRRFRKNARLIPDTLQTGREWVFLKDFKKVRIYPAVLKKIISPSGRFKGPIYLGDVN